MDKHNIRIDFAYDGTEFHGFQRQKPHLRTVQGELETAIFKLTGERISLVGAGRTDAGVHAREQVANFFTASRIPPEQWPKALNSRLPRDLVVHHAARVPPHFHARRHALHKTYRYTLYSAPYPDVFMNRYAWHLFRNLSLEDMREGGQYLVGTWDFTSYCSAKTVLENRVRTIQRLTVEREGAQVAFQVQGNGFLFNMVRIIVGTLVEVGMGKRKPEDVRRILLIKDRQAAGVTAPPQGLTLWEVVYPELDEQLPI